MCIHHSRYTHGSHDTLGDDRRWSVMVDDLGQTAPERIDVLSLDGHNLEAVTFESLGEIVSLEVFRGVTSDGNVIVVNEEFDVEVLSNRQPSSLCVVTLLLRSIRAQAEDDFVAVGQGDTINHGPHVSKTSGGEFDSGGQTQLGVTGKLGVGSTVVEKVFGGNSSLEGREEVLGGDTMA